jgi:exopolysaccharide production protein ExoQ
MPHLILFSFLIFAVWLIRQDTKRREGISSALWIPTLWVGIIASRPVSAWTGIGGSGDTLDGSPADRAYYLTLILAALFVLSRRAVNWGWLIARNWPLVVFYGFLLVSVLWANSPFSSFKRWFKESGNILMVLVILTDPRPLQAFRAVFVRCAYLLIPLSLIFIRYFPDIGRRYNIHSGAMEAVGVTFQKNSLGTMILVCGLILLWDWLQRLDAGERIRNKAEKYAPPIILGIAVYLLFLCDSKTSILSLAMGSLIVVSIRFSVLRQKVSDLGLYALIAAGVFFVADRQFGISEAIIRSLGRDMTFTGRTEVWAELMKVGTDPLLGTGFMSFWDDERFQSKLPYWVAFSAHNGYIEVYLAGGWVGVGALSLMLLGVIGRINRALSDGSDYSAVRFAILVMALIANFAESNFACMTPLGLLFILAAIGQARPEAMPAFEYQPGLNSAAEPAHAPGSEAPADRRPQMS